MTRDQSVTLIYQSAGLYLTVRGKAMENGTEGDVVNVLNLQSKRTVIRHRDRPRPGRDLDRDAPLPRRRLAGSDVVDFARPTAPVAVAASTTSPAAPKAE